MRLSIVLWVFVLSVVLHSIISVESKKSTKNGEAEVESRISEQKSKGKVKKYTKYSAEQNSEEYLTPKSKSSGKFKKSRADSNNEFSKSEPRVDAGQTKKFNKKKNKPQVNVDENSISDESVEETPRGKNGRNKYEKPTKVSNKKSKQYDTSSEIQEKPFKKVRKSREVVENSNEIPEETEVEPIVPKKIQKKNKPKASEETVSEPTLKRKKRQPVEEILEEVEEEEIEAIAETEIDTTDEEVNENDSEFCTGKNSNVDGCNDGESNDSADTEETDEEEIVAPKKIKYSTKFAHEKQAKKDRNKEAESILKLHRKAELNPKNSKSLKKLGRLQDEDEESSEEVLPRRRPAVFEDEEI